MGVSDLVVLGGGVTDGVNERLAVDEGELDLVNEMDRVAVNDFVPVIDTVRDLLIVRDFVCDGLLEAPMLSVRVGVPVTVGVTVGVTVDVNEIVDDAEKEHDGVDDGKSASLPTNTIVLITTGGEMEGVGVMDDVRDRDVELDCV